MMIPPYLKQIAQERRRRIEGLAAPDPEAVVLWHATLALIEDEQAQERLRSAYNYACAIDYKHEGLTSEIYLAHPTRVATLGVLSNAAESGDVGVIGMLHNVFEVAQIPKVYLAAKFGLAVVDQIHTLTVNRSLQWDSAYKEEYYARICGSPKPCRVIKIFDKLDNLFVLGLNKDEAIRTKYIAEIEKFVLPMVARDLPEISSYFEQLVIETRNLGYFGAS